MIALIAALSKNRVIGKEGRIPWKIKGEQRRFKELTTGNVVIMGRRSYEEIGRPLPGRTTIVVSSTKTFTGDNCYTARSLQEAIRFAGDRDIFISGGAGLYEEALPLADRLYITEIDRFFDGDTYFPAFDENAYFVSMPTAASHDGMLSPQASIKDSKKATSVKAHAPIAVIGDSEIIANAPPRLLSAGCADLISNFTAIKDWKLAHRLKHDSYSSSAASLSLMSAKLITDNAENIKPGLEESARLVIKSLFSSGMAISIAGSSRPASGSEHKFSHALDLINEKSGLHGEQCGIGTILMMNVYGGDWEFIRDSLKSVGAPTTAKELGVSDDDIIEALTLAHTIRPERYTILGDNGFSKDAAYEIAIKTGVI